MTSLDSFNTDFRDMLAMLGERVILLAIRYGRCQGCSARDGFLVMKAPASAAGRAALAKLTLTDVRAAFA